ncbi:hypothetical protein LPUS_06293 [Lasallia pustulata]|uniref:DUF7908 domain-containing protein n=1 Tax=Lasallia pustulata TaxID=136370 RepID=A0A1W5D0L3_9LECA|nr:hypothetical protein LPUS_06293 [Lasallia pustulata]
MLLQVLTSRQPIRNVAQFGATSGSIIPNLPFILTFETIGSKEQRRGSAIVCFVGANVISTASCTNAVTYTVGGQLFTQVNGTTQQLSSDGLSLHQNFVPSRTPGSIATTFSIDSVGQLLWTNGTFFNGNALFCIFPSGVLVAAFQQNAQPSGCVFINFNILQREFKLLQTYNLG